MNPVVRYDDYSWFYVHKVFVGAVVISTIVIFRRIKIFTVGGWWYVGTQNIILTDS